MSELKFYSDLPEPAFCNSKKIGGKTREEWLYIFAGQAMRAYIGRDGEFHASYADFAKWSADQADALLRELEARTKS
jgi:hypothetical protein